MNQKHVPKFFSCIKCSCIPFITISNKRLKLFCRCGSSEENIASYQSKISFINNSLNTHRNKCEGILFHSNKKAKGFCLECKEYLCNECLKYHKEIFKHSIIPYSLNTAQHIKMNNDYMIFCLDCFETLCYKCIKYHNTHYYMTVNDIKTQTVEELFINFKKVKHSFKRLLTQTKNKAIKIHLSKENVITKEYKKCIIINKRILQLISQLFTCYKKYQHCSFCLYSNIYKNTVFSLKKNYKTLPQMNSLKSVLRFFKGFSIIESNNRFDYSKPYLIHQESFPFYLSSYFTVIILLKDKVTLSIGDTKGNLIRYSLALNTYDIRKVHSNEISDLIQLKNNTLLSCSCDKTIRILEMKGLIGRTCYNIIASFEKHMAPVIQAIEINKYIIASIDTSGFLFLWNKFNKEDFDSCNEGDSTKKVPFVIFYCKKQKILFKMINGKIYFAKTNLLKFNDSFIKGITVINKSSICHSKDDRLYIGGYSKEMISQIFIININSIEVVSVINYDTLRIRTIGLFHLYEYANDILIYTDTGSVFFLNKTTLSVSKIFIIKKGYEGLLSIEKISYMQYIGIKPNSNHIIFYNYCIGA